jgi:Brp/Blh family beta-carotene 15,15'-monooxygenase
MNTIASKRLPLSLNTDMVFLLLGAILVILQYVLAPIPMEVQVVICALSIVLLGIPHGALDHLVEARNNSIRKKKFSLLSFLALYIGKMVLFGIIWIMYPPVAFLVFLVISAIHFGETDMLVMSGSQKHSVLLQFSHGSLILGFLLLSHVNETMSILKSFPLVFPSWLQPGQLEQQVPVALLVLTGIHVIILSVSVSSSKEFNWINYLIKTTLLIFLMTLLPLILAFTFYFGLWHSFHALNAIRGHLSDSNSPLPWTQVLKRSIPFSLAAFILLALLLVWATATYQLPMMLMFFFIGIAILTAPHLDVMHKMYKGRH